MECDAEIGGKRERKDHEKPVGGIKKRGLETAKEGRPAKKVGIPEGKMPFLQFLEPELTPPKELARQVLAGE